MQRGALSAAILAAIFAACPHAARAQNFDDVRIRSGLITEGIYMLHGSGGDVALLVNGRYAPRTPGDVVRFVYPDVEGR